MRRPGPVRRRDHAWALAAGVTALLHVLWFLLSVASLIVEPTLLGLVLPPAAALQGYWFATGCWRRTYWGAPSEADIVEANRPLTRRQHRSLTVFLATGLTCVLALGAALAVQLLEVR